ncbi:GtrA family protein [Ottowia sp.]|uniref:GtrA family protein n=1 Tax=Ottowia sp. TaxID=1898956 RepID=UPI003A890989
MSRHLRSFFLFGVVGAAGFVVDVAALYAAIPLLGPYGGRVLSFLAAATFTWALNRRITFRAAVPVNRAGLLTEWARYLGLMVVGAVINYAAYVLVLQRFPAVAWGPALGVAVGSLAGLAANYFSARFWVFGVPRQPAPPPPPP